jgi:ribose-phosphate pyrophosphokinase
MSSEIKLFAGTSCPQLAGAIAGALNLPLSERKITLYANDNIYVRLQQSVRGQDVYVIQTTSAPVQYNLMELLILLQTLRLDSARRITAVVPYLCYARSDKKDKPRVPITARLVADLIQVAGADRYMTLDLHAGQIQGFFSIPGDVLTAFHILTNYIKGRIPSLIDPVVVAADLGFAKKARNFAAAVGASIAFIEKRRAGSDDHAEAMSLIGDVDQRDVIIVDDEIDTAGSMVEAVRQVKRCGARRVSVVCVHPVFSGPAVENLMSLPLDEIVITDTIPVPAEKRQRLGDRLTTLSVAPMLAEVISRAHAGRSVGELFSE